MDKSIDLAQLQSTIRSLINDGFNEELASGLSDIDIAVVCRGMDDRLDEAHAEFKAVQAMYDELGCDDQLAAAEEAFEIAKDDYLEIEGYYKNRECSFTVEEIEAAYSG